MNFEQKKILLILTGGIACYKTLDLIRTLQKQGAEITPVMTESAKEFVTALSVASLSKSTVYDDLWSLKDEVEIGHIQLARTCDAIIVAPATANFMAKIAHGFADDLASTLLLATDKPILFVPSMNPHMYLNPVTQSNMMILKERGFQFVEPDTGLMACGETGIGRFPEEAKILTQLSESLHGLNEKDLKGKRVLITLGATQEPIDPVRFISNHSSGKQGLAIAKRLKDAGAEVVLLKAHTTIEIPNVYRIYETLTAEQMAEKASELLNQPHSIDIAICAAAVCDWRPENPSSQKLKKGQGHFSDLTWVENPDILKLISTHINRPELVVGFAAETETIEQFAKLKLEQKKCDMILYNQVGKEGIGFGHEYSEMGICTQDRSEFWGKLTKTELANKLLNEIKLNLYESV